MATRLPILGPMTVPDEGIYLDKLANQLTLATATTRPPDETMCYVIPNLASDLGLRGHFSVPKNYSSSPVLVIRGIIDGSVDTNNLGFGIQLLGVADNESFDQDLATGVEAAFQTNTYSDEDVFEETISISTTLAADDDVAFFFYRDDSASTWTGNALITGLFFQYTEA